MLYKLSILAKAYFDIYLILFELGLTAE